MVHDGWIFSTSGEAKGNIKIPNLKVIAHIFAPFHVTNQKNNYNVIVSRDLIWTLYISLYFQNNFVDWKENKKPIKPINCKLKNYFTIQDSKNIKRATDRIKKILDATNEKAIFKKVKTKLNHLNSDEDT